MRKKITIVVLLTVFFGMQACGYKFSGTGSLLAEGTKTIAVPGFINNTNEPYVDVEVTRAVADEFIADGRLRVEDLSVADVALKGRVVKFEVIAASYTADSYVQQYKVRLVVDANLEDQRQKKTVWKESGIECVFISEYKVTIGDITTTKIAKEDALKKASRDIALTLRSRVLEGF